MTVEEAAVQLQAVPGWELLSEPDRIRRTWTVRDFKAGMDFFEKVTEVAEAERHHPDLHLVGYRNVSIEIWTHAINGLSLNDFILAARIDEIPVVTKNT
jgi:4a-hydroxytetrahydrobiopterin dehydratase